jgi:hypothetical protein
LPSCQNSSVNSVCIVAPFSSKKFLQLEWDRLCFKINVSDKAQQTAKGLEWHNALIQQSSDLIKVRRPKRKAGNYMTVAILADDYRRADAQGLLDLQKTVQVLRDLESFMDAAARIPRSATSTPE